MTTNPFFQFGEELIREFGLGHHPGHGLENRQVGKNTFSIFFYLRNEQAATKGLPYWATESRVCGSGWASGEPSQAEAKNFGATLIPRILLVLKFAPYKSQSPQVGLQENCSELEGEEEKNA